MPKSVALKSFPETQLIKVENVNESSNLLEEYKKLNDQCDAILKQIELRKQKSK